MTESNRNELMEAARQQLTAAAVWVAMDPYSGLPAATGIVREASSNIRAAGDDPHADEAMARANECPAILAIPWPFIYIASTTWIAAVRNLRDALPYYVELQAAADDERRRAIETRSARAAARWEALSATHRAELERVGITQAMLRALP